MSAEISTPVRVRYAPSPTGSPHIGNIRTALFDWLLARHTGGTFMLRIEDTDRRRLVEGSLGDIKESLRWLGLQWDEGPEVGGPYGPYVQSERLEIYRDIADRLVAEGKAYRCYCTRERLAALHAEQEARKEAAGYDRHCRDLAPTERSAHDMAGDPYVIRFMVPREGQTTLHDVFRGEIVFENATLEDHVLLKADGYPTYHLAAMVDDHLMMISHVLRGEEWISSAPLHILLYQALGWTPPLIGHVPLILGKDRKKLSKRSGDTDVLQYRSAGYLPEALVNFLALLGWSPPDGRTEFLSRDELAQQFSLERIQANPAIFDVEKLDWMNGAYIRQLPPDDLADRLMPFLQEAGLVAAGKVSEDDRAHVRAIAPLIQERIKRLTEAPDMVDFFFRDELTYEPSQLVQKGMTPASTRASLEAARDRLAGLTAFDEVRLEAALRPLAEELALKTSQLFGALRVAVTGRAVAPPLFQTMAVLGRERVLHRIDAAIGLL